MHLRHEQIDILLRPIATHRVKQRSGGGGKQLSYVEGYEIRAHLNRIFGFTNWSLETETEIVYADQVESKNGNTFWHVGAKAKARIILHPQADNDPPTFYEDVGFDENAQGSRAEATETALKSAATDALKRAAANLGDQFGLSLYKDGSVKPLVRKIVGYDPPLPDEGSEDGPVTEESQEEQPSEDTAREDQREAEARQELTEAAEDQGSGAFQ